MGHLTAGAPNEIRIYESIEDLENEKPKYVKEFIVHVPTTRVTLGEIEEIDLTGRWEGFTVITDSVFAEMNINPNAQTSGSGDSELFEGCEEEFGVAMMAMIQELMKEIMHKDIPTTIIFNPTDEANKYTGTIYARVEEVVSPGDPDPDIKGNEAPFTATYENGRISINVNYDDDIVGLYTGSAQDEDNISGTFTTPELQSGAEIFGGNWRATRAD